MKTSDMNGYVDYIRIPSDVYLLLSKKRDVLSACQRRSLPKDGASDQGFWAEERTTEGDQNLDEQKEEV